MKSFFLQKPIKKKIQMSSATILLGSLKLSIILDQNQKMKFRPYFFTKAYVYSLEAYVPLQGTPNEYPQHVFLGTDWFGV